MVYFENTKILCTASKDKSIKFWEIPIKFREGHNDDEEEFEG